MAPVGKKTIQMQVANTVTTTREKKSVTNGQVEWEKRENKKRKGTERTE